ncbi:MAG: UTP--glucose-1-phosphate uridylyltransferase [Candidatus Komeilibacteria bacterium RIFOXYC1_FULL_37_11]|uniref:UTP--glucose-1-phosphate uridylyltransferase n=1 Tax=Candidatus Komeilibacteria bacterium RIFOXYC1_FULL_37_11 TaxID=1798555 RepID=A0A1G2BW27_9BACT|nr:MAG: UTP--glucose-1-phosphate uridylyltransferase [Candidatus Komeilibacteria bacterium RIFOXYC1_FULL_37_11]OGY95126.1 MAG: UTP--glucose-1-phosphate uridylyltransferase [Candidatus Komeilibacteria bacterium RIFOXYD1_FULL_37_29]OGY96785.1 MAG: UTP--glucose-1-phosphate uridylyltransferase [Candidatus Komeilibacteria bacterium RIFOXYD2_FULL_37_8]
MKKVKKAIVAVAGSGTRLLPATKSMPKEMLPIVDKPAIQWVVEELVAGGIEDIILVTKWDKKPLEDHFDHSWALENELAKAGKKDKLAEIRKLSEMANFIYVRQKGPYGNGTPVLSAASLVDDEPFMYVWGDDLVKSKVSFTKQMIDEYNRTGHLMIGVQEVPRDQVNRYGIVSLKDKKTMQLDGIIEKPDIKSAPSRLADFGRMILNQDIINVLRKTKLGKGKELWIVDAIRDYIKAGGEFYAKKIEDGQWLTTGDPLNLLKANLEYAKDRKELRSFLKKYLQNLK